MTHLLQAPVSPDRAGHRRAVAVGGPGGPWLVDASAGQPGLPLVIFPHAGAGPSAYRRFAQLVGDPFRPLIVQLPGRERRIHEPPCDDLPALLPALRQALAPLLANRFVFYGHSMGALLAFELARHLRRAYGVEPDHLVVSGRAAPSQPGGPARHRLPDDQLSAWVCGLLGTPPEVAADPDMRALLLPALRADLAVCETYRYRPEPPLDCPISSFAGDRDREAPSPDMAGWARETRSQYRHEALPGDHFFNLARDSGFAARLLQSIR
jgi:medium-chain acyl-[acyl-carrier-protein] hydrolase